MSEEKIGMYSTEEIYEELATGFLHHSMVDAMYFKIKDLQQKVEQLENENFNIRENIHLERISLPPELTKDKDFMELYDIPSYKDLQQKVEQLEKENIKQKEIIENLTTMTVCGDKKQIKNTAQYKLEQLENIRKEAIEYMKEFIFEPLLINEDRKLIMFNENLKNFENILNKGSENNVKKDNTNSN